MPHLIQLSTTRTCKAFNGAGQRYHIETLYSVHRVPQSKQKKKKTNAKGVPHTAFYRINYGPRRCCLLHFVALFLFYVAAQENPLEHFTSICTAMHGAWSEEVARCRDVCVSGQVHNSNRRLIQIKLLCLLSSAHFVDAHNCNINIYKCMPWCPSFVSIYFMQFYDTNVIKWNKCFVVAVKNGIHNSQESFCYAPCTMHHSMHCKLQLWSMVIMGRQFIASVL